MTNPQVVSVGDPPERVRVSERRTGPGRAVGVVRTDGEEDEIELALTGVERRLPGLSDMICAERIAPYEMRFATLDEGLHLLVRIEYRSVAEEECHCRSLF